MVIGGGLSNVANGYVSTIGGGRYNRARGLYSTVAGGGGTSLVDSNSALGDYSAIGGGRRNIATGLSSTIAGGYAGLADTSYASVGGGFYNDATGYMSMVGGGGHNAARGSYSVVCGGGGSLSADSNSARGNNIFIGGGAGNSSMGFMNVIGGGDRNEANADWATIGGGRRSTATGDFSTVCGGDSGYAYGLYATVAGGESNRANSFSFAAGRLARASHFGAFVWESSTSISPTESYNSYTFTARCANGARFYTAHTGTATGVSLAAGGGAWANLCDVRQKNLHGDVSTSEVLEKISTLPLHRWSYKSQDAGVQHIGPTAQDFHAAFGLGESDTTINTLDPDGIALTAIQELAKRNAALEDQVKNLMARLQTLEADKQATSNRK